MVKCETWKYDIVAFETKLRKRDEINRNTWHEEEAKKGRRNKHSKEQKEHENKKGKKKKKNKKERKKETRKFKGNDA